jgi:putative NIF3 family GTP cyclohydrolase 1 type 2
MIKNAKNQNYDIILTGEAAHYHLTLAKEINQSVILA